MDFITGLPELYHQGHWVDLILVIVNCFTKMNRFIPVSCTIQAGIILILPLQLPIEYSMSPQASRSDSSLELETSPTTNSLLSLLLDSSVEDLTAVRDTIS